MSKTINNAALLLTCSMAALLATAGAAAAQAPVDVSGVVVTGQKRSELVQPAATGSRLGITVLETPASVEVLSGDLIRERGDLSIIDAVTRTTGVTTAANGGNGGTGLTVRGFTDQGSVMQLYDGIRLYPGAGTVTFPFDPWTVERVEVMRGPASVLFGQGAIGGVINVIPRKPNTQATEIEAEAGYGSENTWHAAAGAGGPINQQLAYRVDASVRGSDGWVNNGKSDSQALSASLRFAPTDKLTFLLSNDYAIQNPMDYYGVPAFNGGFMSRLRHQNYEVADSVIHYIDNQTRLRADWQATDDISVTNTVYRLTSDRTWHNLDTYFFNGPNLMDRTDYFGGEHHQTQVGDQLSGLFKARFGAMENDLVLGLDANNIRFQHVNNFTFIDTSGCCDPINTVPVVGFNPGLFVNPAYILPAYRTETNQLALFAEDRLKLTEQLSIVAGVRREHANVRRYSDTYDANLHFTGEVQAFSKNLDNTSGRIGVVYQPVASSSIYAQYTTGTDPLGSLITTSSSQINFTLATARQVEVGYKQTFMGGKGEFTAALYDIVKNNLLTRDFSNPALVQQVGQQSSRGVEVSLVMPVTSQVSVEANAAVLQAKFDKFFENVGGVSISRNGKHPTNTPNVSSNLWLTYTPIARLRLQGGLRYVGETFSDNANTAANRLPDYLVLDAGAAYQINSKLNVRLSLYNLTDKLYASNAYNPGQWILGRPRSVDVTLSARF
jgi:iron complex outermembrane receptor protein